MEWSLWRAAIEYACGVCVSNSIGDTRGAGDNVQGRRYCAALRKDSKRKEEGECKRGLQEVIEAAILCDEGSAGEGEGQEYFMIG